MKTEESKNDGSTASPLTGRPVYVFTDSSWLINLDQISCAKLKGENEQLEEVDVWFNGQSWPAPALTLKGKDADHLVRALWSRSHVKRHFIEGELESEG